mgnify:FL=1|jgi:hypothetical protein
MGTREGLEPEIAWVPHPKTLMLSLGLQYGGQDSPINLSDEYINQWTLPSNQKALLFSKITPVT